VGALVKRPPSIEIRHYMTEPIAGEHADVIRRLRLLADMIDAETVAGAFVASLGSRALATRSALGSYAFARVLPDHALAPLPQTYATICGVCGWSQMPLGDDTPDLRTATQFAVERQKWGGVQHLDPKYAAYDLGEFHASPGAEPTQDDWRRLDLILRTPTLLGPDAKAADLERAIQSILPSNKHERRTLIRILGYIGVLEAPGHPSFFDGYISPERWDLPPQRFAEWGYPVIWWRARHGVRMDAVAFWFPHSSLVRAA
jgi:hypothetical protein